MDIEELARRVQAIEDTEAVKKLHQRYMDLMDDLRYGEVLDLFTEDAAIEVRDSGVLRGPGARRKLYLGLRDQKKGVRDNCHFAVHPDITVTGDTAAGTWLVYMLYEDPEGAWVQGRNEVEYRKEAGRWKISRLKFTRTLASRPDRYP
jgi:ketosteroid isomerase-like protein